MKLNLVLIILLSISININAQVKDKHVIWGQMGFGSGFVEMTSSDRTLNVEVALNYKRNSNNFSLSFLNSSTLSLFSNPEYISSIEVMYGKSYDFEFFALLLFPFVTLKSNYSIYAKSGIAFLETATYTDMIRWEPFKSEYGIDIKNGFGIPIEVGIRSELFHIMAFDLSFHTNINSLKKYSSINWSVCLGNF